MKLFSSFFSRVFGVFASCRFPKPIQCIVNKTYAFFFKLDMREFLSPCSYKSLNLMFTRSLERPRSLEGERFDLISPSDSTINAKGKIENSTVLQIKGKEYKIDKLLGDFIPLKNIKSLELGGYINLYLSPSDYHRYHSPCRMKILEAHHIPGALYPVNLKWLHKKIDLFCENERVILACQNAFNKRFYIVFVGALNVGKMRFEFDERIQTNAKNGVQNYYTYKDLWVEKGSELGRFEMGSTIVLLWEKDDFVCIKNEGENLKFGEVIAKGSEN